MKYSIQEQIALDWWNNLSTIKQQELVKKHTNITYYVADRSMHTILNMYNKECVLQTNPHVLQNSFNWLD